MNDLYDYKVTRKFHVLSASITYRFYQMDDDYLSIEFISFSALNPPEYKLFQEHLSASYGLNLKIDNVVLDPSSNQRKMRLEILREKIKPFKDLTDEQLMQETIDKLEGVK